MNEQSRRHHGFALMLSIVLIGLVAITLASLGMAAHVDAMRTRAAAEDAQLRQLLLAGAQTAQSRLAGGTVAGSIALPDSLASDGASVTLTPQIAAAAADTNEATIQIDAALGRRQLSQRVHFIRNGTAWQIESADLAV